MRKKINYITYDPWWNSDLPLFKPINLFFSINAFVFSSKYYTKHFSTKESPFVENIYQYERKYRLKNPGSFFSALNFIRLIKKTYCKEDILLYVFGDDFYFNFLFLLFAKRKHTIVSIHNFEKHADSLFFEMFFKWVFIKFYTNFHFHSKIQYEKFIASNPSKNAFYTEMSIKDFGNPNHKIDIKRPGKKNFLFFGFIRDYKRVDLFIEAANKLQNAAHYIIAGECHNWEKYQNLILNNDDFTCDISFIDNDKIADYFTQADFLVLPYSDTTQSGPLLIAYNYGLPIIASNLEMFSSMVQSGFNGYLFESGDANSLYHCLKTACNLTKNEYEKLRENQLSITKNYVLTGQETGNAFNEFISRNSI